MFMVITSFNNNHIKDLIKLNDKKYRDKANLFLVDTLHLVKEAISSKLAVEVIICSGYDIDTDVKKTYVSEDVMKKLSSTKSNPKYMAVVKKKIDLDNYGDRLLILDNVQDPGNLGAIIRSAVAFNIDTIVLSDDTVDLYNPKVIRASQGMLFHINIIKRDIVCFIGELKKYKYAILGTDVNGGINIKDININGKYAFVIGNEGNGIRDYVLDMCDKRIYIKMNNNCESLNASVAASIIMYELDN